MSGDTDGSPAPGEPSNGVQIVQALGAGCLLLSALSAPFVIGVPVVFLWDLTTHPVLGGRGVRPDWHECLVSMGMCSALILVVMVAWTLLSGGRRRAGSRACNARDERMDAGDA